MPDWQLSINDPLHLTLAADATLTATSYTDDQIWELAYSGDGPPALAFQTTYGWRANNFRMFPRFRTGDTEVSDPSSFASPLSVDVLYPNYLKLHFSPFPLIDVLAEYWVPESKACCGKISLHNRSYETRNLRFDWVGILTPIEGQPLAMREIQGVRVLTGQTGNLAPVIFMVGGGTAAPGPYPAFSHEIEIPPQGNFTLTWAQAAHHQVEESFQAARNLAARNWEAEIARLEIADAAKVKIETGNPDLNAVLGVSQNAAFRLIISPTRFFTNASFVLSREPISGYSTLDTGQDYNYMWNGQSPVEAYYLADFFLPSHPLLVRGWLDNFLRVQEEDGTIDLKPGPGGQRSCLLATPLLAALAWKNFTYDQDQAYLLQVFKPLTNFVKNWLSPIMDQDQDGFPEWDHPLQTGLNDHPSFEQWQPDSHGINIRLVESPGLAAFLVNECQAMVQIAELIDQPVEAEIFKSKAQQLCDLVEETWDPNLGMYRDRDRDCHTHPKRITLGGRLGAGEILLSRKFDGGIRLVIIVKTDGETTRRPVITITGIDLHQTAVCETVPAQKIAWSFGRGNYTSENAFTAIERIEITGLSPEDEVEVSTAGFDYLDLAQLLPLWAGIPSAARANELVEKIITNPQLFWRDYGLPTCLETSEAGAWVTSLGLYLPYTQFIAQGMLRYGYRAEAAALFLRLANAVIKNLKSENAFRKEYNPEAGTGQAEKNLLGGLAPVGLFLEILGVKILAPNKFLVEGFNPFLWEVTVHYRGAKITRGQVETQITFPDGQQITIDDPGAKLVTVG